MAVSCTTTDGDRKNDLSGVPVSPESLEPWHFGLGTERREALASHSTGNCRSDRNGSKDSLRANHTRL